MKEGSQLLRRACAPYEIQLQFLMSGFGGRHFPSIFSMK